MAATKVVCLKVDRPDVPAEDGIAFLAESGYTYVIANELDDILRTELLNNFKLKQLEHVSVRCIAIKGEVPSDWKQHVHDSNIDMTNIEAYNAAFVIWGQTIEHEEGIIQPYIFLTGFTELNQMEGLLARGLEKKIIKVLQNWVYVYFELLDREIFMDKLKTELDAIADVLLAERQTSGSAKETGSAEETGSDKENDCINSEHND